MENQAEFLVIPKEEFINKIEERIATGKKILEEPINGWEDFEEKKEKYGRWNRHNIELLKNNFNRPKNSYKTKYENCTGYLEIKSTRSSLSAAQKVDNLKNRIERKLEELNNIIEFEDFIKTQNEI